MSLRLHGSKSPVPRRGGRWVAEAFLETYEPFPADLDPRYAAVG